MISSLGTAALVLTFLLSASAAWSWCAVARGASATTRYRRLARTSTWGALAASGAGCLVLVTALVAHDFSVRYVAENGGRAVPTYYTVISLWADLEGSLLLWVLVLAAVAVIAAVRPPPRAGGLHPWAMTVVAGVLTFFAGLAVFAASPFERVSPAPADGPGPNPLLQDHPLMGVHPPLLYVGYVALTVPFAYAVAALVTGSTGTAWIEVTRRWTLVGWTALTVGVLMGAWWSYEVLGWGGYWSWDPVENAAILPWFTATALLHSMMVQRRRATLQVWNLALATSTFLLVLIGTFLTRSGVIGSVHAFTQSAIGPLLLGFTVVVLVGVLALFVWRSEALRGGGLETGLSREAAFLGNNLLLVGLAFTVLLGTVFPLLVEAVTGDRVSVGAPYFNRMAVPLALATVVLMGVGPLVPWAAAEPDALLRRLVGPSLVGVATVAAMAVTGARGAFALLTFGLAAFVAAAMAVQLGTAVTTARRVDGAGRLRTAATVLRRRRRLYGGLVVHLGVVLAAVAIAASSTWSSSGAASLRVGDSFTVAGYTATLESLEERETARRSASVARVALRRDGRLIRVAEPELSLYPGRTQAVGTPSVRTGLAEDLYVVLTRVDPGSRSATIRLAVNPLVLWLWVSAGVMAAGAAVAGWPTRRRRAAPTVPAPAAACTTGVPHVRATS